MTLLSLSILISIATQQLASAFSIVRLSTQTPRKALRHPRGGAARYVCEVQINHNLSMSSSPVYLLSRSWWGGTIACEPCLEHEEPLNCGEPSISSFSLLAFDRWYGSVVVGGCLCSPVRFIYSSRSRRKLRRPWNDVWTLAFWSMLWGNNEGYRQVYSI